MRISPKQRLLLMAASTPQGASVASYPDTTVRTLERSKHVRVELRSSLRPSKESGRYVQVRVAFITASGQALLKQKPHDTSKTPLRDQLKALQKQLDRSGAEVQRLSRVKNDLANILSEAEVALAALGRPSLCLRISEALAGAGETAPVVSVGGGK